MYRHTRNSPNRPRISGFCLLAVAALSDRMAPGLRAWLSAAKPQARLRKVEVAGVQGGTLRARGRVEGLGFALLIGNAKAAALRRSGADRNSLANSPHQKLAAFGDEMARFLEIGCVAEGNMHGLQQRP